MSRPVVILGLGAEGLSSLSPKAREALASATFLAGGTRHRELVGPRAGEFFTITDNVDGLIARLERRKPEEHCVVLASGDPLFYGIGHRLSLALGRDAIEVEPAVSSMQLAFARAGLAWHDATMASVHGRPLARTLIPLLGRPKIGLFTQDGASPSHVAAFFQARGLDDYDAWVGERLGTVDERVVAARLPDLIGQTFDALNVLLLNRTGAERATYRGRLGLADEAFATPERGPILLTHADVRALVVARFLLVPDGPIWDLGAGLGGVTVELARAFPDAEIIAVERSETQRGFLQINRARFEAYNVRIVAGEAPSCLKGEEAPSGIFLGGSGGQIDPILALVLDRLPPGGVFVANFVGLEHLTRTLDRLKDAGWPTELAQVQISQGQSLAGLTTLAPLRPVWVVRALRPS